MGVYTDIIGSRSIGTSVTKTQLSGDNSGNATAWTIPTGCKGILWIQPELVITTPTSAQNTTATLAVESTDIGLPPYEVFAAPLGNAIATNDHAGLNNDQSKATYPLMFDESDARDPSQGLSGAQISFYGTAQVANTGVPWMGAMLWWTDEAGLARTLRGPGGPFNAKVGGAYAGATSDTSTGTATGAVTGTTATISGNGMRYIRALTGIVAAVTTVSALPFSGSFFYSAPEMKYTLRARMEPSQGALGVNQQGARLTYVKDVNCPVATPTTISMNAFFDNISSTAGVFEQGFLYQ